MRCTVKPAAFKVPSRNLSAPPSAGVTERQRTRSRARARGSADMTSVRLSIPQQLVDAGLRAGTLVHALDDDRAVKVRSRLAVRQWLTGHRPRDDHRIRRHFALINLAGLAVHDLGGEPDINAHAEHGAFAHDHTFDDFGA